MQADACSTFEGQKWLALASTAFTRHQWCVQHMQICGDLCQRVLQVWGFSDSPNCVWTSTVHLKIGKGYQYIWQYLQPLQCHAHGMQINFVKGSVCCRVHRYKSGSDSATCMQMPMAHLKYGDSIQYLWRHLQQLQQHVQHPQINSEVHQGLWQVQVQVQWWQLYTAWTSVACTSYKHWLQWF